jgi:Helix-turn-helix.
MAARRDELGITNAEVGRRSGIPQSTVDRTFRMEHPTSLRVLEAIARGLGLKVVVDLEIAGGRPHE